MLSIGAVIIHATGSNPYEFSRTRGISGDRRQAMLRQFRDTNTLPEGFSLWNDRDREPITDRNTIDWGGLR